MEVDYGINCYKCGSFGYLVYHCCNQEIISERKRIEYGKNVNNINNEHLKVEEDQDLD